MARGRSSFKMGTVEMLVLYLLEQHDLFGRQIALLLRELSGGRMDVPEPTLYPMFYKLLDKGYISDREEPVAKHRVRVYYHLEAPGAERLAELLADYAETTEGITKILHSKIVWEEDDDKATE